MKKVLKVGLIAGVVVAVLATILVGTRPAMALDTVVVDGVTYYIGDTFWDNTWTEVEYLGNGQFGASISTSHQVFFDGDEPKKHEVTDYGSYVLLQSARITTEVYPYYARYFDVQHEEVRVEEERWVVQRLFKEPDTWRDVDAYNPTMTITESIDAVAVTVSYTTGYGPLTVEYYQRDGSALKHNITFTNTSGSAETFRVLQRWSGIAGGKVNDAYAPVVTDEPVLRFHSANKTSSEFTVSEDLWDMVYNPDGTEKVDQCLQRPVTIGTAANGLKADFIYGNWALAQGESLQIDPDTATLDNPTVDAHIRYDYGASTYYRDYNSTKILSYWYIPLENKYRSYVQWNIYSIPDGSTVTKVEFRYHGRDTTTTDTCSIHAMTNKPSAQTNNDAGNQVIYDDAGDGTAYLSDGTVFPEVGTGKDVGGASGPAWDTDPKSDLESQLSANWFAIGITTELLTELDVAGIWAEEEVGVDPAPTLYVEYTIAAPTVTTQATTDIEDTTATGNGNITATDGNCDERGHDWDIDSGAPYANEVTEVGSFGTGAFTSSLTSLPTGTTIYTRAKAHNSGGWGYGDEVTFLTKPAAPTNVAATDGDHTDKVVVTWTKSTGATGYKVYEGVNLLDTLGDVATYDDTAAPAPTITPGTAAASDGTSALHVVLSLSGESANNGSSRTYKVVAFNATGDSDDSATNAGYRGVMSLTYQWQRSAADSDASYSVLSGGVTDPYNDTTAPAGVVTPGTANATDGSSTAHVTLSLAGESVADGVGRWYYCEVGMSGAVTQDSTHDRGYRTTGSLTYQWQRSAADSDASYGNISGATSDPYNDTAAPAPTVTPGTASASDGTSTTHVTLSLSGESANIGEGRYFRCVVSATGTTPQNSSTDRGYRDVGSLTYQWQRSAADSDADYGDVGGATTDPYDDTEAPTPTITPGSTVASDGTDIAHVDLSLSGTSANDGDGRYYRCVLSATGATPQNSTTNRGHRDVGSLTYQWRRSAADSDASYSNIDGATSSTYEDTAAPTPTITHGAVAASDGTEPLHVTLANTGESANVGDGRYYRCVLNATGATEQTSTSNRGYRGVGTLTYQWYRSAADSDASYGSLGGATTDPYNDTTAPTGVITPGTASASDGTSTTHVTLSLAGESVADGGGRYYKVYHTATGAVSGYNDTANRGYRGTGAITYQWQRSAADSDASFSNISGGTTDPYNDTEAPGDGSGRWFLCLLDATGTSQAESTHDRGFIGIAPTVSTLPCSGFAELWAIIVGYIDDEGTTPATVVGFDYGLTDAYGGSWTDTGTWNTSDEFWTQLTDLSPATVYHYRAKAFNSVWGYGEDMIFSTRGSATRYEYLNTGGDADGDDIYGNNWAYQQFTTGSVAHSMTSARLYLKRVGNPGEVLISLKYADGADKPTGADRDYTVLDGDLFSTDMTWYEFTFSGTTMNSDQSYALVIRALTGDASNYIEWRWDAGGGLANAVSGLSTDGGVSWTVTGAGSDYLFEVWGEPILEVLGAQVFSGYLEDDDWLIVLAYKNYYTPWYPNEDPRAYFYIQLLDDTVVKAQVSCSMWNYRPGSIYIAPGLAATLEWGATDYKIRLYGNFGTNPYSDYSLAAADWRGTDLSFLDSWVIAQANSIGDDEGTSLTSFIVDGEVLNALGHTIFSIGIPELATVRPNLFEMVTRQPEYSEAEWDHIPEDWETKMGPQLSGVLTDIGDYIGIDGQGVGGAITFVAFIVVVAALTLAGHLSVGLIFGYAVILTGSWYGVVDYPLLGVITFLAASVFVYRTWLIR